ncbi:MAG: hypothetical protein QM489_06490 [Candidatus Izemoplasma sp.]
MQRDSRKYQYSQLEIYKELLELAHLKRKTIIVNLILVVLSGFVLYFLLEIDYHLEGIIIIMLEFVGLLFVNLAFYSYDKDHYNNLKILMYVTVIYIYIISITIIYEFQTPSVFTTLFLAYAITSIYQDYKSMMLSNFALFVTGSLFVIRYDEIFEIAGNTDSQTFFILVFLLVFVLLLTLSSYILIKRKTFFYNQLAHIKESEVRNIELLMLMQKKKMMTDIDHEVYYEKLTQFSKVLSKKIGIENVFDRKIKILKDMQHLSGIEIKSKYPDYSLEEIEQLKNLELRVFSKMRMIGIKASQSYGIKVARREIFSESQFKSFNHYGDDLYTKIISFVVFYTLLKIDKPYLNKMTEQEINDYLLNSEYYYKVDRNIINIYIDNSNVFEAIIDDILKGVK